MRKHLLLALTVVGVVASQACQRGPSVPDLDPSLDPSLPFAELTAQDLVLLCEWRAALLGGEEVTISCGPSELTFTTEGCLAGLDEDRTWAEWYGCDFTVGDYAACEVAALDEILTEDSLSGLGVVERCEGDLPEECGPLRRCFQ